MSLLNARTKLLIEAIAKQHGSGSLLLGMVGKNKKLGKAIYKYYTRPVVAADVVGGKLITNLLNNIKGNGRIASGARNMSKKFWSNEIPIMVGGKASVIPRVPLLSAPIGHVRDIVIPASALVGAGVAVNALSGLGRRKKIVVRANGQKIGPDGYIEEGNTNYEAVPKEAEGGFFYE